MIPAVRVTLKAIGIVFGIILYTANANAQGWNIGNIIVEAMNQAANKPGFANGPLSGAGIPKIRNNSQPTQENPIEVPDSGGDSWQKPECTGGNCNTDTALMEQPGTASNAAVVSPLGSLQETMSSTTIQKLLSADKTTGGTVLSPLGTAIQSWTQVSASASSAMISGIAMANAFTSQRYLAEQNAELSFASAGSQGKVLSEAYRNCVGNLVRTNYSYLAAQELCLRNQQKFKGTKLDLDNPMLQKDDVIHFGTHPSHPLFKGNVSVREENGNWKTYGVDNQRAPSIDQIFPLNEMGGNQEAQKKVIRLRHLMFMPTLANLAPGMNVFRSDQQGPILFAVRQLAGDWLRLFGDIEYSYQKGEEDHAPLMAISIRRIKPTFSYAAAVDMLGSAGGAGWNKDLFGASTGSSADQKSIGYRQFVTFREHLVYDRLWRVTANYCRVLQKRTGSTAIDSKVQFEGFWNLNSGVDADNKVSTSDIQILSNSFMVMDEQLGNDLYLYAEKTLQGSPNFCDLIDPAKATSATGSADLNGATSVARLVEQIRLNQNATTTDTTTLHQLRSDFFLLAKIIAGDQVNTTIKAAFAMLGTVSGGDFESKARDAGFKMVAETAGQYDPDARRQQLIEAFGQFTKLLTDRIQAK